MTSRFGTETVARPAPASLDLPRCVIVVLTGDRKGTEVEVRKDLFRVGKAKENDLSLPDETVSRVHFEIVRDGRGWLVRDLSSTNGTFLEGAAIQSAYLQAGAVVTAGTVQMKVRTLGEAVQVLPSEAESFGGAVGRSLGMRTIFGLLERIRDTDTTVLFLGETGTGKDVLARALHDAGPRASRPFVVVDCGAVAPTLIESELFGHERGAFTGATGTRQGAFEVAGGGTVFLDEIGELPIDLQPKLLRVLEQREVRRVGGNRSIPVDIRILAATRKDLRKEIASGGFREDLYFRLAVLEVSVLPLRERREDVPLLAEGFLRTLARGSPPPVPAEAMDALRGHDWPGNVRELRNVLERALAMSADRSAPLRLPELTSAAGPVRGAPTFDGAQSYGENKERAEAAWEKAYLTWLLARADGNVSEAARQARMDRKYLHKLLKKHGLEE